MLEGASVLRRCTATAIASLLIPALPSRSPAADVCREIAIPGAYSSDCMGQKRRTFTWPGVGQVLIEQGDVGPGTTGAAVWSAGERLADVLCSQPELVSGKRVVELGCGTGLCGIVAARLGASSVLLTDGAEPQLARAARNAASNDGSAKVGARPLLWGAQLEDELRGSFDLVIASDVLYQSAAWRPLAQTATELMVPHKGTLLLVEAGHELTPAASSLGGFISVAEGCGLTFEPPEELVGDALVCLAHTRT